MCDVILMYELLPLVQIKSFVECHLLHVKMNRCILRKAADVSANYGDLA